MAKDNDDFQLSFKVIFRLLIFALVLYFAFSYLSAQKAIKQSQNDPTVLGEEINLPQLIDTQKLAQDIYQSLPENSRQKLETINQNPAIITIQQKVDTVIQEINGFPEKQIKDIKKQIIQSVYQDLMEDLND